MEFCDNSVDNGKLILDNNELNIMLNIFKYFYT